MKAQCNNEQVDDQSQGMNNYQHLRYARMPYSRSSLIQSHIKLGDVDGCKGVSTFRDLKNNHE